MDKYDKIEVFGNPRQFLVTADELSKFVAQNGDITINLVEGLSDIGKALAVAPTPVNARQTIGAGTSNLILGTTDDTAKIGSWNPTFLDLPVGTSDGTVAVGNHTHADATIYTSGFMSAVDKTKVDNIGAKVVATVAPVITITDPPDNEQIQASFLTLINALKTAGVFK